MAVERSGRGPRVHCAMTIFALLVVAGCSRDEAHSEGPMSPSRTGTREAKPAEPVEARPDAILELGDPERMYPMRGAVLTLSGAAPADGGGK